MEEIMRKESGTIEKNEGVQAPEPEHNVERTVANSIFKWCLNAALPNEGWLQCQKKKKKKRK